MVINIKKYLHNKQTAPLQANSERKFVTYMIQLWVYARERRRWGESVVRVEAYSNISEQSAVEHCQRTVVHAERQKLSWFKNGRCYGQK